jgi:hypothetical protein
MAARGSNAFWWALIGFFMGIVVTLGGVIASSRSARGADDGDSGPASVAAAAPAHPHRGVVLATPAPILQSSSPATVDEQVAEDAAAAGMTSRARTPQ